MHGDANLPNLFIVGVQKAGTTTLHDYLSREPEIFMPSVKEPGFFMKNGNKALFKTPQHEIPHCERPYAEPAEYASLYVGAEACRWRGDSTTGYFQSDHARNLIQRLVPDARILICLREPVSRSYSAYNWARKAGIEPCDTFERALAAEEERQSEDYWFWYQYAGTSLYSDKVRRWREDFEQVRIVLFDDLRDRPAETVQDILSWLGVERHQPVGPDPRVKNPSGIPRSSLARSLRRLISPPPGARGPIMGLARRALKSDAIRRLRSALLDRIDRTVVPPAPLSPETRARLRDYFRDDVLRLEKLTGLDLREWRR